MTPDQTQKLNQIIEQGKVDVEAAVRTAFNHGMRVENERSTHLRYAMTELARVSGADVSGYRTWETGGVNEVLAKVRELADHAPRQDSPLYRRTKALRDIRDMLELGADTIITGKEQEIVTAVREMLDLDKKRVEKVKELEEKVRILQAKNDNQTTGFRSIARAARMDVDDLLTFDRVEDRVRKLADDDATLRFNLENSRRREDKLRQDKEKLKKDLAGEYQRGVNDTKKQILQATLPSVRSDELVVEWQAGAGYTLKLSDDTCPGGC